MTPVIAVSAWWKTARRCNKTAPSVMTRSNMPSHLQGPLKQREISGVSDWRQCFPKSLLLPTGWNRTTLKVDEWPIRWYTSCGRASCSTHSQCETCCETAVPVVADQMTPAIAAKAESLDLPLIPFYCCPWQSRHRSQLQSLWAASGKHLQVRDVSALPPACMK